MKVDLALEGLSVNGWRDKSSRDFGLLNIITGKFPAIILTSIPLLINMGCWSYHRYLVGLIRWFNIPSAIKSRGEPRLVRESLHRRDGQRRLPRETAGNGDTFGLSLAKQCVFAQGRRGISNSHSIFCTHPTPPSQHDKHLIRKASCLQAVGNHSCPALLFIEATWSN